MSLMQELASWTAPKKIPTAAAPAIGAKAPSTAKLPIPSEDKRPVIVAFLRHCGCPFAEATFINMRETAASNPDISFVAVSHSNESHTAKWLSEVGGPGTTNPVKVIVDDAREIYAAWGLGVSGWMHVLSPSGLAAVRTLGKTKGIWNRPTESGSRWQTGGNFGVDAEGIVRWGGVAPRADDVAEFEEAVSIIKSAGASKGPGSAKL